MRHHPYEIQIQEIASFMTNAKFNRQPTSWTNAEIKELFPGMAYAKAWKILKQRGRRNGLLFFEDGKWHYFA